MIGLHGISVKIHLTFENIMQFYGRNPRQSLFCFFVAIFTITVIISTFSQNATLKI